MRKNHITYFVLHKVFKSIIKVILFFSFLMMYPSILIADNLDSKKDTQKKLKPTEDTAIIFLTKIKKLPACIGESSKDLSTTDAAKKKYEITAEQATSNESLINKIIQNNFVAVEKLLMLGVDPNESVIIEGRKFTALDIAVRIAFSTQDYSIVDMLVEHGAKCTGVYQLCLYGKMRVFYKKYETDLNYVSKFKPAFYANKGLCAGLSRLCLCLKRHEVNQLVTEDKPEIFQSIMKTVADWSKNNTNTEDINNIKYFIYYVTFFQSPFNFHNKAIDQYNFKNSFDLTPFVEKGYDLTRQYVIVLTKMESLKKLLSQQSFQKKHIILDFSRSDNSVEGHEVYLYIDSNSNFQYYDSNNLEGEKKYVSIEEISKDIKRDLFAPNLYNVLIFTVYDFTSESKNDLGTKYPNQEDILRETNPELLINIALCALKFSVYSGGFSSMEYYFQLLEEKKEICPDPNMLIFGAASVGNLEGLKFLISKAGTDINAPSKGGDTVLMMAAFYGHNDTVLDLIDRGANVNTITSSQETALTYAVENKHKNIIKILFEKIEQSDSEEAKAHAIIICNMIKFKNHFDVMFDSIENAHERVMILLGEKGKDAPNHLLIQP